MSNTTLTGSRRSYNKISDEVAGEMKALGKTMTAKQISKELNVPYSTVQWYMSANNIPRKMGKRTGGRPIVKRTESNGFFNEHERENWLV